MQETQSRIRADDFYKFLNNYREGREGFNETEPFYVSEGRKHIPLMSKNLFLAAYVDSKGMIDIISISSIEDSKNPITRGNKVWEIVSNRIADKYDGIRLEKFYGSFAACINEEMPFEGSLEDLKNLMDNVIAAKSELEAKIQKEAERILSGE